MMTVTQKASYRLHLAFMRACCTMEAMNTHEGALDPLGDPKDGHILTQAIIDTIHEPLIVLDEKLRVIVASRAFYKKFDLTHEGTKEKMFYELGNGQWDIASFRTLLEQVIPTHNAVHGYEIEYTLPFLVRAPCSSTHAKFNMRMQPRKCFSLFLI